MNESGDKLSRAYRDFAREEPSSALDTSILAASARALKRPSVSRRWGVPAPRGKLEAVAPQRKDIAQSEAFPQQQNVAPAAAAPAPPAAAGAASAGAPASAADAMQRPAESQSLKRMAPAGAAAAKVRTVDEPELELERIGT